MSEEFSNDPGTVLVKPGSACQIFIGDDLVITGRVDRYTMSIRPGAHDCEINGRGAGLDLVDCSADINNPASPVFRGSLSPSNALDLAQKLSQTFGITARSAVSDLGGPIGPIQIYLGETPYEVIERVARYAGYLVYEDELGTLVLDRVGTDKMASGFAQGVNVEAASASLSVDQRFSEYITVISTVAQLEGDGAVEANVTAKAVDTAMVNDLKLYRPRITVSTQTTPPKPGETLSYAQRMANWEMARRIGRSQAVQITCDSWRDSAGMLWQPNRLANVNLPALKIVNKEWIIATVTFRKDQSGTHADLVLMPPDAFSVQPSTLNLWDNEIGQVAAQAAQNLAPI